MGKHRWKTWYHLQYTMHATGTASTCHTTNPWQRKICRNFEPWTIFSIDTQKGEPGRMFDICILMIWWPWHTFAIFCHLLPSSVCHLWVFLLSSWVVDTAIWCIFSYVQTRFAQVLCCDQWTPKVEKLRRFLQLNLFSIELGMGLWRPLY